MATYFEQEKTKVWPIHQPVLQVFSSLATQWRIAASGPSGIDYSVLPVVMDLHNIHQQDRTQLFADLQVMESAALEQMRENNQQ
jgi:hypothetical protein